MKIKKNFPIVLLICFSIMSFDSVSATCRDDILLSTPNSRFVEYDNGTVTDTLTGLMWMRCSLGQTWSDGACTGIVSAHNWKSALDNAENNNFAGHEDWFLPNIKELSSIIEYSCVDPAINTTLFPDTPSTAYWTSTPEDSWNTSENGPGYAWQVKFSHGANNLPNKNNLLNVRLVRLANVIN